MSGEQISFLAGAADATADTTTAAPAAEQSTTTAVETPPESQAAAGQTAATQTETKPSTSGGADAPKPAPVEVKVPEGVELDGELLAAIRAGDPQKVVDAYAKTEQQQRLAWEAKNDSWRQEVEKDPELGGKNMDQTRAWLNNAITRYGSKELQAELKSLGLDNNPHLVRFVAKVGKAMAEDTVAGTTAPTNGSGKPDFREWFPGQNLNP
jgi:hypothetical protein